MFIIKLLFSDIVIAFASYVLAKLDEDTKGAWFVFFGVISLLSFIALPVLLIATVWQ